MSHQKTSIGRNIQELEKQLQKAVEPIEQLRLMDQLSFQYYFVEPPKAAFYAQKVLQLAQTLSDNYWIMKAYIRLGNSLGARSQYKGELNYLKRASEIMDTLPEEPTEKASLYCDIVRVGYHLGQVRQFLPLLDAALAFTRRLQDPYQIASVLGTGASIYRNIGLYSKSLLWGEEALNLFTKIEDSRGIALVLWEMGNTYAAFDDWDNGLRVQKTSLSLMQEVGDKQHEAILHKNIGTLYQAKENYQAAIESYKVAIALFKELGNAFQLGQGTMQLGRTYLSMQVFTVAEEFLLEAQRIFNDIDHKVGCWLVLAAIAELHMAREEWGDAIEKLTNALSISNELAMDHAENRIIDHIAQAYEKAGNLNEALKYYKQYIEHRRSLLSTEVRNKIAQLGYKIQFLKEDGKNIVPTDAEALEKQMQIQSQELKAISSRIRESDNLLKELKKRVLGFKGANDQTEHFIQEIVRDIDNSTKANDAWNVFQRELQQHEQQPLKKLIGLYPTLTRAELRTCLLLRMSLSNKEIASLLNISARTVDTHRTNIRKKMGLKKKENLVALLSGI